MSVYQRFISYMYEYHGNTRHQNCGYARIDNRNNLLKLEIHMKVAPQTGEEPIHIYGCFQRDGQLYGIEFGQHVPTLGMVNWRTQCDSDDLAQTGISFNDLEGLVLSDQSTVSYCSIWNDQSIQPLDLIPYPVTSTAETDAPAADDADAISVTGSTLSADAGIDKTLSATSGETSEARSTDTNASVSVETASHDPSVSPDTLAISSSGTDTSPATLSAASSENAENDLTAASPSAEDPSLASDTTVSGTSVPPSTEDSSLEATVEDLPRAHTLVEKILAQEFVDTTPQAADQTAASNTPPQTAASAASARWNRLTHRFPKDTRFTDGELKNCVRVTPREIPVLRREGFHIAGNRFILHCFQRDPHCLIGKIGDSEQYIFAVPGIYDNQERFMANMFGFPCFKSETPGETLEAGQKGYWYKAIH